MPLRELEHNRSIGMQLSALLETERLVHAFLFAGSGPEERRELGLAFAKALLCEKGEGDACGSCLSCRKFEDGNHEDLIMLAKPKDRAVISVPQVEELQDRLRFAPYGPRYAVVIEDAQLMNTQAQNKLLKLLEEPPAGVVFILLSESSDALLSTVVSRCSCYWLEEGERNADPRLTAMARDMLRLIFEGAPFYKKKNAVKDIIDSREDGRAMGLEFIDILEELLLKEAVKLSGTSSPDNAKIKTARRALSDARVCLRQAHSVGYTLKQLCLRV